MGTVEHDELKHDLRLTRAQEILKDRLMGEYLLIVLETYFDDPLHWIGDEFIRWRKAIKDYDQLEMGEIEYRAIERAAESLLDSDWAYPKLQDIEAEEREHLRELTEPEEY